MKRIRLYINRFGHCPPRLNSLKAVALMLLIAMPGSLLVMPLVAWWLARQAPSSHVTHG